MKVGASQVNSTNNVTNRAQREDIQNQKAQNEKAGHKKETRRKTVFAGNLNVNQDLIANKKALGQKQAVKIILDVFTSELNIDNNVQSLKDQKDALNTSINDYKDKIKSVQDMKKGIQEGYGVSDDSQEQKDMDILSKAETNPDALTDAEKGRLKDLKLLMKAKDNPGLLTDKEQERLKDLKPLTDYQKEIMESNKMESFYNKKINDANKQIEGINQSVEAIGLSRLKTHPVLDAKKVAEDILKDTAKEVVGMLLNEAVENTDKKLEDQKKADEDKKDDETQSEKKTEENSKTGSSKSDDDSLNSIVEKQDKVMREIKKQALKDNLILDDIKGIIVDAQS
ncbi:hypothetical protein [Anaerocolumna jejuensis]|uniref:hypothetical protein n=1 Tax=Anaerocolumna jejuensis TaxID=259063 RepID=UPI003F7C95A8